MRQDRVSRVRRGDLLEEMLGLPEPAANTPGMSDDELASLITTELSQSLNGPDSEQSQSRARALDFYFARPFGNEVEGRSQIVISDVMDTTESIMPSLMRVFSTGKYVEFEQQGPDDATAVIESEYIEHVFANENDGFNVLMDWFKDAMLSRVSYVMAERMTESTVSEQVIEGLPDDAMMLLWQERGPDIVEYAQTQQTGPNGMPMTLHSVRLRSIERRERTKVFTVPANEIRYSGDSPELDECRFVAHITTKQKHELQSLGYGDAEIEEFGRGSDQAPTDFDLEELARQSVSDMSGQRNSEDQGYECVTAFIRVDADGDGVPELRRVQRIGGKIVANEVAEGITIVGCRPIRFPHRHEGISIADLAMDLMFYKSVLVRNIFDNLYYINNQRLKVLDGRVNLDDLLTHRPAGIVRVKQMDAAEPLAVTPFSSNAYGMVEYLDTTRENRTGIPRYNQGLDAGSLNKTATGVTKIMAAGQERLDLIARVMADAVSKLFLVIHGLERKYQMAPMTVRLSQGWTQVQPSTWKRRFRASTRVGLGHVNNETQLGYLMQILGMQQQAMGSPIVDYEKIYYTVDRIIRTMGIGPTGSYAIDPAQNQNWQPQPSFEEKKLAAEMEIKKYEIDSKERIAMHTNKSRSGVDFMRVDSKERVEGAKAAVNMLDIAERHAGSTQGPETETGRE